MENIIKQLRSTAKDIRLSSAEKAAMKNSLIQYAKAHPAPTGIPSPFSIGDFRNKRGLTALILGGLFVGSSVSFAAENTLPGDILYPVKIHLNEALRGAIAVTPKAKAMWDVQLVERRLIEIEKLAAKADVPVEIKNTAEDNLTVYTTRAKDNISKFEKNNDSEDAITIAGELADTLGAHESVLIEIGALVSATSTKEVAIPVEAYSQAEAVNKKTLESALMKLSADRKDAEQKHNEIKNKHYYNDAGTTDNGTRDIVNYKPVEIVREATTEGPQEAQKHREEIRATVGAVIPAATSTSEQTTGRSESAADTKRLKEND